MRRFLGPVAVLVSLAVAVALGAYVVDAAAPGSPTPAGSPATLTLRQRNAATEALRSSAVLSRLSQGRSFTIQSTGEWTIVGELVGAAFLIDFGHPVEFRGEWPVMEVDNAVSEADKERGVPDPARLDIHYRTRSMVLTAREFSVSVDFNGNIKDISTVPPRPGPPSGPDLSRGPRITPPTAPFR